MTNRQPEPNVVAQPPVRCPGCGGRELTTTDKAIDRNTYWRCLSCGEVWNLDRRDTGSRFGYRR
jgi:transposase-like protein